ncbi:MAG: hypothetical protein A2Y66_03990 [Nitrospirae bacterium RBG_13_41_22]|nr:MAG: hypothetical protein A2Y66_03990 [Nitrospirae bacterium RBG_13_41_22]
MIKLRGHHLICLHFFKGEGYNPEFVANLREILKRVEAGEEVKVHPGPDDVCKMCPYLKGEICFYDEDAEAGIREMDRKAIRLLGLKTKESVKWIDIREKVPDILHIWAREHCRECDWRTVCEKEIGRYRA